jgi:hypothetical protein
MVVIGTWETDILVFNVFAVYHRGKLHVHEEDSDNLYEILEEDGPALKFEDDPEPRNFFFEYLDQFGEDTSWSDEWHPFWTPLGLAKKEPVLD